MKIETEIAREFEQSGLHPRNIRLVNNTPESFGDYIATLSVNGNDIKVMRDRGQYFLEIKDKTSQSYVDFSILYPKAADLYRSGSWSLRDLILLMND